MARIFFFATKFYHHFSENPPNVSATSIFAMSKTHVKMMKITHFDVLRGPFVDLEQASRRVPKIIQNYAKMHMKLLKNEHEKMWITISQGQKIHPIA